MPADAKLAWWQQELRDWSGRRSRHPLGRLLEPVAAPWSELAQALPAVQEIRSQPLSLDAALALLQPFAQAVVAVEAVLFERKRGGDARAIAVQWLAARLAVAGASAAPAGTDVPAARAIAFKLAGQARAGATAPPLVTAGTVEAAARAGGAGCLGAAAAAALARVAGGQRQALSPGPQSESDPLQ